MDLRPLQEMYRELKRKDGQLQVTIFFKRKRERPSH